MLFRSVPVILQVYDGYMAGENAFDLAVDVEEVFPLIRDLTWCHRSQVTEWLPWVGRHQMSAPGSPEEWSTTLRARFDRKNRELNLPTRLAMEVFRVTAWGEVPTVEQLQKDLPVIHPEFSRLDALRDRLRGWRGE